MIWWPIQYDIACDKTIIIRSGFQGDANIDKIFLL